MLKLDSVVDFTPHVRPVCLHADTAELRKNHEKTEYISYGYADVFKSALITTSDIAMHPHECQKVYDFAKE